MRGGGALWCGDRRWIVRAGAGAVRASADQTRLQWRCNRPLPTTHTNTPRPLPLYHRYDLDLGATPYKALRYHRQPLRGAAFHATYPLFASSADDGAVHVFHGRCAAPRAWLRAARCASRAAHGCPATAGLQKAALTPTRPPRPAPPLRARSVYADLLTNPLIVPVKVLRGHTVTDSQGVLDVAFHPSQPWVFTAGADGYAALFCN